MKWNGFCYPGGSTAMQRCKINGIESIEEKKNALDDKRERGMTEKRKVFSRERLSEWVNEREIERWEEKEKKEETEEKKR